MRGVHPASWNAIVIPLWMICVFLSLPAQAADGGRSLLVMDFQGNNVDADTVRTVQGLVTVQLARYPSLDVLGGEDVRRMLDLEAQKAQAGCEDDSVCLSEIADALGAELVVAGTLGRIQSKLVLTLTLIEAMSKEALNRSVIKADDLGTLMAALEKSVAILVEPVVKKGEADNLPEAEIVAKRSSGPWPWITMGAGIFASSTCCVGSMCPGFYWTSGVLEADNLRRMRDGWAESDNTTRDARELREAHDESIAFWNGGLWHVYWVMVGIAVVGVVAGTGGLIWGLAE
jgi:TolB-like protein